MTGENEKSGLTSRRTVTGRVTSDKMDKTIAVTIVKPVTAVFRRAAATAYLRRFVDDDDIETASREDRARDQARECRTAYRADAFQRANQTELMPHPL